MDRERSFIVCILFGLLLLSIFFLFQQNIDTKKHLLNLTLKINAMEHISIHQSHEMGVLINELEKEKNKKEWWEYLGEEN